MNETTVRAKSLRRGMAAGIAAAATLLATGPSKAHPHIWIDARATLVFEQGALIGVEAHWTLDPFVSALLMEDFDADKDGTFDADEAAALEQATFVGLSEFGFYTHIRIEGTDYTPQAVDAFRPSIEGDVVVYEFYVPLPEQTDRTSKSVDVAFYDDTYYVELYTEEGWNSVSGDQVAGCAPVLEVDYDSPYYYGVVFPTRIGLSCVEG